MPISLIEACRKAHESSKAEGQYGRHGWFTVWDVKRNDPGPQWWGLNCKDLDVLVAEGLLVEGTRDEALDIGTSARIYRPLAVP